MFRLSRSIMQGARPLMQRNVFGKDFTNVVAILPGNMLKSRLAHDRGQVRLKVMPANVAHHARDKLGHDDRNMRLGRVISPHLTIYSPQLTSVLSITQRITGCALTVMVWAWGIGSLLVSHDMQHYITMLDGLELNETCLTVGKSLFTIPFTFHFFNSIRHILWSFGSILSLGSVYSTGYLVLALSPLSSIGLAYL